jgi:hypothetical protein
MERLLMRTMLAIAVLAFGLISHAEATPQCCEWLIYKGTTNSLYTAPLDPYLEQHHLRLGDFAPSRRVIISSACWRGYIGTWQITNGCLWLLSAVNLDGDPVPLSKVFTNQAPPIKAVWFSGTLNVMGNPHTNVVSRSKAGDRVPLPPVHTNQPFESVWSNGTLHIQAPLSTNLLAGAPFETGLCIEVHQGKVVREKQVVTSWSPVSEHPLRTKEIEAAERINEEQMRQRRERWERSVRSREQSK